MLIGILHIHLTRPLLVRIVHSGVCALTNRLQLYRSLLTCQVYRKHPLLSTVPSTSSLTLKAKLLLGLGSRGGILIWPSYPTGIRFKRLPASFQYSCWLLEQIHWLGPSFPTSPYASAPQTEVSLTNRVSDGGFQGCFASLRGIDGEGGRLVGSNTLGVQSRAIAAHLLWIHLILYAHLEWTACVGEKYHKSVSDNHRVVPIPASILLPPTENAKWLALLLWLQDTHFHQLVRPLSVCVLLPCNLVQFKFSSN